MMTDQPTQADRERALAVARGRVWHHLRISDEDSKVVSKTLLAIHAENERLRAAVRLALTPVSFSECLAALRSAITDPQEPTMTETQAKPVSFIPFCAYESGDERCSAEAEPGRSFCARHRAALNPETQAETGPSDGGFEAWWSGHRHVGWSSLETNVARMGYQAGRASLAGELARVNVAWSNQAHKADSERMQLRAELEAEKATHGQAAAHVQSLLNMLESDQVAHASELAAAARQARVMPSLTAEELARHLFDKAQELGVITKELTWEAARDRGRMRGNGRVYWEELAAVALRFLAPTQASRLTPEGEDGPRRAEPAGASSDSPVPLPATIPAKTRWREGWTETLEEAQLDRGRYRFSDNTLLDPGLIDWAHYRARQARYVPSVGERVVLVASPDRQDQDLVGTEGILEPTCDPESERAHWTFIDATGVEHFIHRDATWRRIEERPFCREAPPDSEIGQLHVVRFQSGRTRMHRYTGPARTGSPEWEDEWSMGDGGSVLEWRRCQPQGEATRREQLLPKRCEKVSGTATWQVFSGEETWYEDDYRQRVPAPDARPVEPTPGVAAQPRRFTTPSEALECLRETIAEECHQEHPAHDAIGALETIEALSKRVEEVARCCRMAERDLDRRVDAGSKRLDELELQARAMKRLHAESSVWLAEASRYEYNGERIARIEREERERASG
jgi:hypothetical protein